MSTDLIFMLVGGVGLFFFGMRQMSNGLKNMAGDGLKQMLFLGNKLPIIGVIVGTFVTCLMQSSSATTVMVVGFANAGLLSLKQAISVIIGANIGTTFTAWLVSLMSVSKFIVYVLPAIGIGFAVNTLAARKKTRFFGQILLGFGLFFLGLDLMKDAFLPFKDNQDVTNIILSFSGNPLMGVLIGMLFTVIVRSSGATIAIVQVMAFNGLISFPATIPIILGDNIGTTITAQLASIGGTISARRAAMSHILFNVIGVGYMLGLVYTGWFTKFIYALVPWELTSGNIMVYIAIANSVFKGVNAVLFLPFLGQLEKVCVFFLPQNKGDVTPRPKSLERHLLSTPNIAVEQARKETVRMIDLAAESVSLAVKGFLENDLSLSVPVSKIEKAVDNLQSEITQYLVELSQEDLTEEISEELPVLIHDVNDIERIGDHAENIVEFTERKIEMKLPFTEKAISELKLMWGELGSMLAETRGALLTDNSALAENVLRREQEINRFQVELKKWHVDRLSNGICDIRSGVIFIDLVDNMEKIGDHLTNIAQGVIGKMRWRGDKGEPLVEEAT